MNNKLPAFLHTYGIVFVAVGLALGAYVAVQHVPVELLVVASRSVDSVCSRTDAWRGITQREAHNRGIERARNSVRLVTRDAANDFEKWSTSLGDFWLPSETRSALPILLSQQEVDIYTAG